MTNTVLHFIGGRNANINSHANELSAICNEVANYVVPAMQGFCSDDWSAKTVLGVSLIPRPGVLVEVRIASGSGAQPDDSLPSFCAGLLSIRTGVGGRSGHGRLYIPAPTEDLCSASRLEGNYLTILANIGAVLNTRFGPTGLSNLAYFGIFSRKLGVTRNAGPPATLSYSMAGFMKMTTWIARPELVTQRKRMLARGQ